MGEISQITEIDEVKKHLAQNRLAVINVCATWCGPCQRIAPRVVELAAEMDHVAWAKVDRDDIHPQDLKDKVEGVETRVRSIPAFLIFKDGKEVEMVKGSIRQIKAALEGL